MKRYAWPEPELDITGTHLMKIIVCPYSTLKSLFGTPHIDDPDSIEWALNTEHGVASIYSYWGPNIRWHIGAKEKKAAEDVAKQIKLFNNQHNERSRSSVRKI